MKSYDPACYDLAAHFLADEPISQMPTAERARQELAAHIQEEVERWIMYGTWREANTPLHRRLCRTLGGPAE